jgi:hypothetical protein
MYTEDQPVKVKNPDGPGWIAAKYCEVAEPHPELAPRWTTD